MDVYAALAINPPGSSSGQVLVWGSSGLAGSSSLKTINNESLFGSGNIAISVDLSAYATTAAVAAGYQPLDSDLTAIAALTTTSTGRALLTESVLPTGSGGLVRATSPTLVTPNIGAATGTSLVVSSFIDASSIRCDGSQVFDTFSHLSRVALDVGRAGGFSVVALGGVFGNPQTLIPIGGLTNAFPALRRTNTEIDLRLADDSAFTSLNLLNVTANGVARFTGYPTSLLPSAASNAGSITYDTTIAKHVGCNGSSWNALW